MPSIRISKFAGITPAVSNRLLDRTNADIAHNCLLWDGTLRPMPKWSLLSTESIAGAEPDDLREYSGLAEIPKTGNHISSRYAKELVVLEGAPLATRRTILGLFPAGFLPEFSGSIGEVLPGVSLPDAFVGVPQPVITSCNISFSAQNLSKKPVNRVLGITAVRKHAGHTQESALTLLPDQAPFQTMFEGDILGIDLQTQSMSDVQFFHIYRTIAGLDSGEQAVNQFDTDWHLIARVPYNGGHVVYFDGGSATTDPLDLLLSNNYYEPDVNYHYMGLLDSGWVWAGNDLGKIDFSERYMYHAWPTENRLELHVTCTQMKSNGDIIYVGTINKPFVVSVAPGEGKQGAQAAATVFPERLPCLARTMTPAPGGVLYASNNGIVALTKNGAKVLTAGLVNPGDVLYKQGYYNPAVGVIQYLSGTINKTIFGIHWNGQYFGFIQAREVQSGD